jgi:hypothetical protein
MDLNTAFADEVASEATTDNDPVKVPVFDRNGEAYLDADGKPAVFLVLGEFSDKVRKFERRKQSGASDVEDWLIARGVAALAGWRIAIKGKAVPFSAENATALLKAGPWLQKYVVSGMTAHSSFFAQKS